MQARFPPAPNGFKPPAMQDSEVALREALVRTMRRMAESGLNRGTSGNASVRFGAGMLITPSGVAPAALTPEAIVRMGPEGPAPGALKPSSEFRMHAGILAARVDAAAVVHCHSRHATILACCEKPIPPIHYMLGKVGPGEVPVAPYVTWGTAELARVAVATLAGRSGCLLAHHGQIALGASLEAALAVAEELEEQAAVYVGTLLLGGATALSEAQLRDSARQFEGYGQG